MIDRTFTNRWKWPSDRIEEEEWLDLGLGSAEEVHQNLVEMHQINQLLGGTRALTRHLFPRLKQMRHPAVVMDLGTGGAGIPQVIAQWARKVNQPVRQLAVDWSARNLAAARRSLSSPDLLLVQADAHHLPVAGVQIDFVISSLFLHHLNPSEVISVLRQANVLARRAVIMSDLVRGWAPYYAFQAVQPFLARSRLTRHDGALSIRRAYTPAELAALAQSAGLACARVYTHFPWRMTLVVEK